MRYNKPTFYVMPDDPVETRRKQLPRGDGQWAGSSEVYFAISMACDAMGLDKHARLSDLHVEAMATLGTGHEVTMKAMKHTLLDRGWINNAILAKARELASNGRIP